MCAPRLNGLMGVRGSQGVRGEATTTVSFMFQIFRASANTRLPGSWGALGAIATAGSYGICKSVVPSVPMLLPTDVLG